MNNSRRAKLKRALELLNEAEVLVSNALDEEQECLDNMPENLECSDRYEKMESAIEALEGSAENIGASIDSIEEAIQ